MTSAVVGLPHRNALSVSAVEIAGDFFTLAIERDRECEPLFRRIVDAIDRGRDDTSSDQLVEYVEVIANLCARLGPAVIERARGASWLPTKYAYVLNAQKEDREGLIRAVFEEAGIAGRYLNDEEKYGRKEERP